MHNVSGEVFYGLTTIALVVAAFIIVRSTAVKQNQKAQAALIDTQGKQIDLLKDDAAAQAIRHQEMSRQIGELQGQLKAYKELPLKQMAEAITKIEKENVNKLEALNKVLETQNIILTTIKKNGKK